MRGIPWCCSSAATSHAPSAPPAQIIEKGRPEGETNSITGIKGRQVPLSEDIKMIAGLMNSQGTKVRVGWQGRRAWIT